MRAVRVQMDFEGKYASERDPWSIGEADSPRYDLYRERLLAATRARGSILDIGSGFGAFLARFEDDFDRLDAVEVARGAVRTGRRRYPRIRFMVGSAAELSSTNADRCRYDAIIFSDVIAYLRHAERIAALAWIDQHLEGDGVALIAAYSPGGRYLSADELCELARRRFHVLEERRLDSGHVMLIVRRRRTLVALTVDYETWQPIPAGRSIDWDADVFRPTAELLDACDRQGARLTLFAEVGEYRWLSTNDPATAQRMAAQWRDAVARGHDVQLHLHPSWLPELGARHTPEGWKWDLSTQRAADFPGDLSEAIAQCCHALEKSIRPARSDYKVSCFRAGSYEAQPFSRLHDALVANGVWCDSSVYRGGRRAGRSYDYRLAFHEHQPYFASRTDPQLKAPPAERAMLELPLFSPRPNERWTFDFDAAEWFAEELLQWRARRAASISTPRRARFRARATSAVALIHASLRPWHRWLNRVLPRTLAWRLAPPYPRESLADNDYFVLIGHSKADLNIAAIEKSLAILSGSVDFLTMSEMARIARDELERRVAPTRQDESSRQVARERPVVMSGLHNDAQSERLLELVPRDRRAVLDAGCGSGWMTQGLAGRLPWAEVIGIDVGADFIERARDRHAAERVFFQVADFGVLPFDDGRFDCVFADNSLEHAFDVDGTLRELHRVLCDGGALVAAIPSDARNPYRICDNHTWKTAPADVIERLAAAGFAEVRIRELDVLRRLGAAPYPPACDRMMYVRAWKRVEPVTPVQRAAELARFVYARLDPETPTHSVDLGTILAHGHAWCTGYAVAAGLLLREEGFDVRWVTMLTDAPPPTGAAPVDAHEVLEVRFPDRSVHVLDAMANVWYPHGIRALLRRPELATVAQPHDQRFRNRGYAHYCSPKWYAGVRRVAVRADPRDVPAYIPAAAARAGARLEPPKWQARSRRAIAGAWARAH